MLELPEHGFAPSINTHNVKPTILADWIEGSALFADSPVSTSDVLDILIEKNIYKDEDFGSQIVADAWSELRRRCRWVGVSCPFRVQGRVIERIISDWQDAPAHSFCLFLALALYYRSAIANWIAANNENYIMQGSLFERLTGESLQTLGWEIYHTGWSSGIQTTRFPQVVADVADRLSEPLVNEPFVELYQTANEQGLDLVCYKPFADGRGGKPVYLMQCASGGDWMKKLHTPNIETWKRIITFSSSPQRAFSMPFALEDDEFFRRCTEVDGVLIDRYRLLSAGLVGDWVSASLKSDLIDWLLPRLSALPFADV